MVVGHRVLGVEVAILVDIIVLDMDKRILGVDIIILAVNIAVHGVDIRTLSVDITTLIRGGDIVAMRQGEEGVGRKTLDG